MDFADGTSSFIFDNNTTLHLHDNLFYGKNCISSACTSLQDAIILGTASGVTGSTTTNAFQGYGTTIENNYFDAIGRAVYLRGLADSVNVLHNTIWIHCGGTAAAAAIEINSAGLGANVIEDNLIECPGYVYGIKLSNTFRNFLSGNTFWDAGANFMANVYFDSTANYNVQIDGGEETGTNIDLGVGNTSFRNSQIGIGTANPDAPLTVFKTGINQTLVQDWMYSSLYYLHLKENATGAGVAWVFDQMNNGNSYPNVFSFYQGRIGIGTTSPSQMLEVNGNAKIDGNVTVGNVIASGTVVAGSLIGNLANSANLPVASLNWSGFSSFTNTDTVAVHIPVLTNAGTVYYLDLTTNH